MKKSTISRILSYLYDQLTGNFLGFLIGASATGLVSQFFETRSIKNLWGLTAKKTVVDKETFQNLEWGISIIIGFVVFEVVTKLIKQYSPFIKRNIYRWIIREKLHLKARALKITLSSKGIRFAEAVHQGSKQAFKRFSNRG